MSDFSRALATHYKERCRADAMRAGSQAIESCWDAADAVKAGDGIGAAMHMGAAAGFCGVAAVLGAIAWAIRPEGA